MQQTDNYTIFKFSHSKQDNYTQTKYKVFLLVLPIIIKSNELVPSQTPKCVRQFLVFGVRIVQCFIIKGGGSKKHLQFSRNKLIQFCTITLLTLVSPVVDYVAPCHTFITLWTQNGGIHTQSSYIRMFTLSNPFRFLVKA